jgi:hypothetical protein
MFTIQKQKQQHIYRIYNFRDELLIKRIFYYSIVFALTVEMCFVYNTKQI